MFDKLFGGRKKTHKVYAESAVTFGRYSDNNKTVAKVNRWSEAEKLFKEKNMPKVLTHFLTTCGMRLCKM